MFEKLGEKIVGAFVKAQAKKIAKQAIDAVEAFNVDINIDNATDVICALIKAKTGFAVPEVADSFVDSFLIKLATSAKERLVEYLEAKVA